jgi:hypothetical protein
VGSLVREDLVQLVAEHVSLVFSDRSEGRWVPRPRPLRFLSLHPGYSCQIRAGTYWAVCCGDEDLHSKKAGASVYGWSVSLQCRAPQVGAVPSAAYALYIHPAETQSHIQCLSCTQGGQDPRPPQPSPAVVEGH